MFKKKKYDFEFFERPGHHWTDEKIVRYVNELREVASRCFDEIPLYQILTGKREELKDVILIIARDMNGKAVGFSSSLAIEKNILHLGLTCVIPEARGSGMTHQLMSKLVMNYILRHSLFSRLWITNCACVISSLGNIALNFENVFPSPFGHKTPTKEHLRIAEKIDLHYREPIAINEDSLFDRDNFVFKASVKDTVFQKKAEDKRYHHRNASLTDFYRSLMNFEEGDEVLQVASVNLLSYPVYLLKRLNNVRIQRKTYKAAQLN